MRISDWSSGVCSSDLGRVDLLAGIHFADARQEVAERQHPLHGKLGKPEGGGDLLDLAAFADQPGKALPLANLVGVHSSHIKHGRASCRERVCRRVDLGGRRTLKKKTMSTRITT